MTNEYLHEIEARCEAATPGPWDDKTNVHPQCNGDPWGWIQGASGNITWSGRAGKSNAAFIAHSREDIPALIAEVKALTARAEKAERERDKAVQELDAMCSRCAEGRFGAPPSCQLCGVTQCKERRGLTEKEE